MSFGITKRGFPVVADCPGTCKSAYSYFIMGDMRGALICVFVKPVSRVTVAKWWT